MRTRAADLIITGICAVLVAAVVPLRPFWLDEVLQLAGTRPERSVAQVIAYVPENPGSAPLGYLVQHAVLDFLGVSRWSARLPAALFGVGSCALAIRLARRLGVGRPWLAALILAGLPLSLRYAAEGRPYSQAVFVSLAATLLFLQAADSRSGAIFAAYLAALLAGVYTLPFTVLAAGGHVLWAANARRWRLAALTAAAACLAALSFVPWMIYARSGWRETMVISHFQFAASWKTPLMLFREISGAGYWGSGLLVVMAAAGAGVLGRQAVTLLGGITAATLAGGVAADAVFGYFVAVRQFICVLPALAIMAAARPAPVLLCALLAFSAWKDWQYFGHAAEDWESAASAIAAELHTGRCLMVEPARELRVYSALVPAFSAARCREPEREIVLAVSPYRAPAPLPLPRGYRVMSDRNTGGTRILVLAQ